MMSSSARRLEVTSQNVANTSTPGYKRQITFQDALSVAHHTASAPSNVAYTDYSQGALRVTGAPLDLALSGAGFFQLRGDDGLYLSRSGQFHRAVDGRIINAQGLFLQTSDGQDLFLRSERAEILSDGVVLEDGMPVARIGVFEVGADTELRALGGSLFAAADGAMEEAPSPSVRQGALESANVEMSEEVITMMAALRRAEAGARVVQAYDTLTGQALSTFGRVQR
jgi:flagellar basal body rod protein FlgG